MRLINVRAKKLEEFHERQIPPYAILSHTWGRDEDELTFQEVQGKSDWKECLGKIKLDGCCAQAAKDGLEYVWIDTCCIDKTNSTELGEAINSMFRWYKQSDRCYAYLTDFPAGEDASHLQSRFCESRWFTRGWTLQELIAPRVMNFYDVEWNNLGDKKSLSSLLAATTGIPRHFLLGMVDLHEASVAQRMSWAARRTTKRTEDLAYCLLGIFDVTLPMIYGEGERAFRRLQEEILRTCQDDSILAWGFSPTPPAEPASELRPTSVFADCPSRFAQCGHLIPQASKAEQPALFSIAGGNLSMQRKVYKAGTGQLFIVLECCPNDSLKQAVCIPVANSTSRSLAAGMRRLDASHSTLLPKDHEGHVETVRIQLEPARSSQASPKQCLISIENALATSLKPVDFVPRACWSPEAETIMTLDGADNDTPRFVARFRPTYVDTHDVAILLDIVWHDSIPKVTFHVVTCSRAIDLGYGFDKLQSSFLGNHGASINRLNLGVGLKTERLGRKSILEVRLAPLSQQQPTADVTYEAEHVTTLRSLNASLRQDHNLCLHLTGMTRELEKEKSVLKSMEEDLANLDKRIQALQEERSTLLAKLQPASDVNSRLSRDVDKKTAQREELAQKIDRDLALLKTQSRSGRLDSTVANEWPSLIISSLSEWFPPVGHRGIDALPKGAGKLTLSAIKSENQTIIRILAALGLGTGVTDENCNGLVTELLAWAAKNGREKAISALLHIGASIEKQDVSGKTPLAHAAAGGHEAAMRVLLENGASVNGPSSVISDPLTALLGTPSIQAAKKRLLSNPLAHAVNGGHEAAIRILLDYGADIESKYSPWPPLMQAAESGREASIRVLLSRGASVKRVNEWGQTALALAVEHGHRGSTSILLRNGAGSGASRKLLVAANALLHASDPGEEPTAQADESGPPSTPEPRRRWYQKIR